MLVLLYIFVLFTLVMVLFFINTAQQYESNRSSNFALHFEIVPKAPQSPCAVLIKYRTAVLAN